MPPGNGNGFCQDRAGKKHTCNRNDTNQKALGVKVLADCYQGDEIVASATQTAEPYDMVPDEEQFVRVLFEPGVECDLIRVGVAVRRWL